MIWPVTFLFAVFIRSVSSQSNAFVCVPAANCVTSTAVQPGSGVIDVRIVTPGGGIPSNCPAGTVACFGQDNVPCGTRFVPVGSTLDGTSYYGAYPWQAYIINQTSYTGSGVLLDRYHVLTAAHKVVLNQLTPQNIRVYMGVYNPANLTATINSTVARMIIHPNFNPQTLFNDIAVLRLTNPVVLGAVRNIGTACLPAAGSSFVGQSCQVAGWGQTSFGANDAPTNPQRQVTVPIVSYPVCRASMASNTVLGTNVDIYLDPNGEICAGGIVSRDACTQDGGAPLSCAGATGAYTVAGLVIWGKGCGREGVYGAYVNVPYYRGWIDTAVAALNAG